MQPPRPLAPAATPHQSRVHSVAATPAPVGAAAVCATPKFDPRQITAATPGLRDLRAGEVVMSLNGSPIAL